MKRARKAEAPTISPTGWPLPDSPWTKIKFTLCGREVTDEDRKKPYNCWLEKDSRGVVALFSCACDVCLLRCACLTSRHNVDRAAEDIAEELAVRWLDALHALAVEFGDKKAPPQRELPLDAVAEATP